jgi:hypothetical protein
MQDLSNNFHLWVLFYERVPLDSIQSLIVFLPSILFYVFYWDSYQSKTLLSWEHLLLLLLIALASKFSSLTQPTILLAHLLSRASMIMPSSLLSFQQWSSFSLHNCELKHWELHTKEWEWQQNRDSTLKSFKATSSKGL